MKRLITPGTIFVEGNEDQRILSTWFPHLQFVDANGKDRVSHQVKQSPSCWGLLDRDFSDEAAVQASQQPASRIYRLQRYCIENYLLEPSIIAQVAALFAQVHPQLQVWSMADYVETNLLAWAKELTLYAAANALIAQWRASIEGDFLQYLGPLPPWPHEQVLSVLRARLGRLPNRDRVEGLLDDLHGRVAQDVVTLAGAHRWINGKVLLEELLYTRVFNLHNLSKARLRDALIDAGRTQIPTELAQLAQKWANKNT